MSKKIIMLLAATAILLSACGGQGEPTLSAADVEGTAVAAAWTMVAMTQEAIPTNTPIPPTETPSPTPLPTFTAEPLPTLELVVPTATSVSSSTDNCLGPINLKEAGPTTRVRIENKSTGTIRVSLNLVESAFGQCGALVYDVNRNGITFAELPRGSWFAYAWTITGTPSTASCSFVIRPADHDLLRLVVEAHVCRII